MAINKKYAAKRRIIMHVQMIRSNLQSVTIDETTKFSKKIVFKASTNSLPILFFNGAANAYFEKYSCKCFECSLKSTKSASHCWSILQTKILFLLNFFLAGKCRVYVNSPQSHFLTCVNFNLISIFQLLYKVSEQFKTKHYFQCHNQRHSNYLTK